MKSFLKILFFISTILIVVFTMPAFSQELDESLDEEMEDSEPVELTDEDIIRPNLARAFEEWIFGEKYTFNVPAGNIYPIWDTIRIHPYPVDTVILNDTTRLVLVNLKNEIFVAPRLGRITSTFGFRRYRYHYGIDIDLNTGDSVYSAFDGMARIVAKSRSYGWVIVVRHNNGLESIYAHLSKTKVEIGDAIKAGGCIGLGGNTGRSRGSHLHLEFRYLGLPINPCEIIDFNDESNFKLWSDTLVLKPSTFSYVKESRSYKYHKIRKGDTLGKIARRYGTTVSSLCRLNKISVKSNLREGRRIRYR